MLTLPEKDLERFLTKFTPGESDDCWEWEKGLFPETDYGAFWFRGRNHGAHRVALALNLGIAIEQVDNACHTCDNPKCVNPNHLFNGTPADSLQDARNKGRLVHYYASRDHCSRGHLYEEGSYWMRTKTTGVSRVCKECDKIRGEKMRHGRRQERSHI